MTQNLKFTFRNLDTDNNGALSTGFSAPKKRSYTEDQIKEIQHAAYADGEKEGQEMAVLRIEKQAEVTLMVLASQYTELMSSISDQFEFLRRQSAELALIIAQKLSSALIAEQPTVEIEKLLLSCLANLNAEPRVVLRVDEKLIDPLKEKIERMAVQAGYPGRVILIGEPDAHPAQCIIEWADGGVSYRCPEQLAYIDQLIASYISRGVQTESMEEDQLINANNVSNQS